MVKKKQKTTEKLKRHTVRELSRMLLMKKNWEDFTIYTISLC